ncbi:MAG: hypothetical protein KAF91_05170 [Nostoc sp. TH1S01]|nr:hypothetical protein [Nostoc sp. TH1S01]
MKVKTVYAGMAIATLIATGMILITQDHALAQNSSNLTEQRSSRDSKSLEIKWLLGFLPWPTWTTNVQSPRSQSLSNRTTTYANNPNKPIQTNIGSPNRPKPIGKQASNYKEVPVPLLIPGLTALGIGLIRKHRQEQKHVEMQ